MKTKSFIWIFFVLVFAIFSTSVFGQDKPNIVLVFMDNLWVRYPASQVLIDHAKSLKEEPPIVAGTPDPYVPKK
jgi:hypothetical protein